MEIVYRVRTSKGTVTVNANFKPSDFGMTETATEEVIEQEAREYMDQGPDFVLDILEGEWLEHTARLVK